MVHPMTTVSAPVASSTWRTLTAVSRATAFGSSTMSSTNQAMASMPRQLPSSPYSRTRSRSSGTALWWSVRTAKECPKSLDNMTEASRGPITGMSTSSRHCVSAGS